MSKGRWLGAIALAALGCAAYGAEPSPTPPAANAGPTPAELSQLCKIDIKGDKKEQWMRLPKAESSVTQHHVTVGGKSLDYTATAGTLIVRDDVAPPITSTGNMAYARQD